MNRICVIGSINVDMVTITPRIPLLGETITGSGFMIAAGGKGANQAVAAARLGADVSMIGCVGNDSFGLYMLDNFKTEKIDQSTVSVIPDTPTGSATILVCHGNNFIVLNEGANACVSPEMVVQNKKLLEDADIIMLQNEIPEETLREVFKHKRASIMFNPAPSPKVIPDYMFDSDILVVNEHECGDIIGYKIEDESDAIKAALKIASKGIAHVIVTLGEKGSVYTDNNEAYIHAAISVPNVVDTTAAGDCFCGAVARCLASGKDIHTAIAFATTASAIAITKEGAQPSLPYERQILDYIEPSNDYSRS